MKVHDPIHLRALRLQRKIFYSLKLEAQFLLGKTPDSILRYEKENQADFKVSFQNIRRIPKSKLIEAVQNSDVSFIADFHTFDQAQRTALRIIREAIRPNERWYIGLELIPSQYQSYLNAFQENQLTVLEFQEKISYREEWGFPWKNYAPIFDWAKENQVPLIAMNRPRVFFSSLEERELHERDQWAAGIITDIFYADLQNGLRPKMIVLYGELHVGTRHLPKQLCKISKSFLKKPLGYTTVHQTDDRLFWKLAEKDPGLLDTEAVQLKKNVFCVFSSTPWAKLQSLVSWAEGGASDFVESEPDYLYMMNKYGETLSEFLGISSPSYEALSVGSIDDTTFLEGFQEKQVFNQNEIRLIRFHVTHNRRIYIPSWPQKVDSASL